MHSWGTITSIHCHLTDQLWLPHTNVCNCISNWNCLQYVLKWQPEIVLCKWTWCATGASITKLSGNLKQNILTLWVTSTMDVTSHFQNKPSKKPTNFKGTQSCFKNTSSSCSTYKIPNKICWKSLLTHLYLCHSLILPLEVLEGQAEIVMICCFLFLN